MGTIAAPAIAAPAIAAPVVAAPAPSVSSQFHSQDEFGNFANGYANINSAKHEQGNAYTGVSGSYSYVDANGQLQTTNYIADGLGFRVQATNLPVAPAVPEVAPLEAPVYTGVAPAPVVDTPEVAAAKAEFQAKFDEIASRSKRSTPAATAPLFAPAPFYAGAYAGAYAPGFAPYNLAPAGPLAYAGAPVAPVAPATIVPSAGAREAVLTKIQLTPGHAVAYRVD